MKLKSIYTILLAALTFTACSDDDEPGMNSGTASVEMAQAEISVRENAGIFNVPVSVTGERNGLVRVEVEVAETGTTPAMDDVHYYVTSKSIVISADDNAGNIEIATVNDEEINEARTFTVTIVKAEGAEIGANTTTTVTLRDEDSDFYEKLKGAWKMNGIDAGTGASTSWNVNITGVSEGEDGYGEILYISGFNGQSSLMVTAQYNYDMETKVGSLEIVYGTVMGQGNFEGLGVCDVMAGSVDEAGQIIVPASGTIPGTWDEDFTTITFDASCALIAAVVQNGAIQGYYGGLLGNITLTK